MTELRQILRGWRGSNEESLLGPLSSQASESLLFLTKPNLAYKDFQILNTNDFTCLITPLSK